MTLITLKQYILVVRIIGDGGPIEGQQALESLTDILKHTSPNIIITKCDAPVPYYKIDNTYVTQVYAKAADLLHKIDNLLDVFGGEWEEHRFPDSYWAVWSLINEPLTGLTNVRWAHFELIDEAQWNQPESTSS